MNRLLSIGALLLALIFGTAAHAAGQRPGDMTSSGAIVGTQIVWCPTGITADFKCTFTQVDAFINAQFSGDFTVNGTGTATLATVNGNVGSFGNATTCVSFTTNAKGLITAASSTTCTPGIASVTGMGTGVQSALQAALNSSTGVIGALTPTNNNCVVGNGTAWTSAACPGGGSSTITAGTTSTSGFTDTHFLGSSAGKVVDQTAVTSVAAGCGTSTGGSAITTTGTVSSAMTLRSNTAASDTIVAADCGNVVYENRATAVAVSIAQAGTTGFGAGTFFLVCNINAGVATITPATSTIGGASTLAIQAGTAAVPNCAALQSDGANYNLLSNPLGSGVAAAASIALSAAGGLTTTIASGSSAMGTSAIASGTCATVVTTSATGVASTDTLQASFNTDPTAVTGYGPSASGSLYIDAWPTSGNVNFKVCNNTGGSLTPGALTLNWRVAR